MPRQHDELIESLLSQAKKAGASAADALCVHSENLSVTWRKGRSEGLERAESAGLGLRVFVGKKQAIISTTDFSAENQKELVERAVAMAKAAPEDPYSRLASAKEYCTNIPELDLQDKHAPDEATLINAARLTEEAAVSVEGISNTEGADAGYGNSTISLGTSEGFFGSYEAGSCSLSVSVLAGEGTKMERDYDYDADRHWSALRSPEDIGAKAAERTLKRLNPRRVSSCQVPVIFDPRAGRALLRSFSGAISGAAITRGTSFLKHKLGQPVFAKGITVVDDPHMPRRLASRPFDAEGVSHKAMNLIEDGVLTTWLMDISSAEQLGMKSTGHATRALSSAPNPSCTNLYMQAGEISRDAMLADIPNGFYVTDLMGMGVNMVTGDYSQGASGFWIENGVIAYPVSELTIAGNLTDMFRRLTPANDLNFEFAINTPTLRIDGMTVAGG